VDTAPVPLDDVLRAVRAYQRQRALEDDYPPPTKRQAERALERLEAACYAVRQALDALPDEMQSFHSGPLRAGAGEIQNEAAWRLTLLRQGSGKIRTGRRRLDPRAQLEAQVARLYVRNGGRIATYDPRRYSETPAARAGAGRRGGRFARFLVAVYKLAGITAPADLGPIIAELQERCTADEKARATTRAAKRRRQADPRTKLGK
jgi:hypothetical protein